MKNNINTILFLLAVLLFFPMTVTGTPRDEIIPAPESYTVEIGGPVKGIFDPVSTPMTWADLSEGGKIGTETFTDGPSAEGSLEWAMQPPGFSDIERSNLERGMRLPSFNVPGGGCGDSCPVQ